jgi:hypothetical protein
MRARLLEQGVDRGGVNGGREGVVVLGAHWARILSAGAAASKMVRKQGAGVWSCVAWVCISRVIEVEVQVGHITHGDRIGW